MRNRKRIAAVAVALALWAWSPPDASAQPRPPGPPPMGGRPPAPPMGGGRPPGPVMGPGGGPGRPGGLSRPGGIGAPERPGAARPGVARPGGIGAPMGTGNVPGSGGLGSLAGSGALSRNSPIMSRQALASQANLVRNNFNFRGAFSGDWWGRYTHAWRAAGWVTAAAAYSYPTWGQSYGYCGYTDYPHYYDYGSNVVYERQYVYVNGDAVATQDQYAQQAKTISDTGKRAQASVEDDWLPLGVFAMTQGGQVDGNDLFQLTVNKSGIIRGNYYTAICDTTLPVYGSVDEKTQRAAWTVGDRNEPVFEAGFANLTRSETTMLVHWGKDRAQQWNLVRIEQPSETSSGPGRPEAPGLRTSGALPER